MSDAAVRSKTERIAAAAVLGGFAQLIFIQLLVQHGWHTPYSWSANNISDLSNAHCGLWGDNNRYVCSPYHVYMSASIVLYGLTVIVGVIGLRHILISGSGSRVVAVSWLMAGAGALLAGIYTADVHLNVHVFGALLLFAFGNLGLILNSPRGISHARGLRFAGILFGSIGLLGMVLFFSGNYLGLGMGGLERVVAYLRDLWFAALSLFVLPAKPIAKSLELVE